MTKQEFQSVPRKQILVEVSSGEISIETGADGAYLLFNCDCIDALPYCKAQCCALLGTTVELEELEILDDLVELDYSGTPVMKRDADGFCACLNRDTRTCSIYEQRPQTCRQFHCTKGAEMRGWKLSNIVHRQNVR